MIRAWKVPKRCHSTRGTSHHQRKFCVKGQEAFCNVRVFNPLAKCYLNQSLLSDHKRNGNEKKAFFVRPTNPPIRKQRYGGMSRECSRFELTFTFLRPCSLCIRGSRSSWKIDNAKVKDIDTHLTVYEENIDVGKIISHTLLSTVVVNRRSISL